MGKKKANNYSKFLSFLLCLFELTSLYINNLNAPSFFFLMMVWFWLINQTNPKEISEAILVTILSLPLHTLIYTNQAMIFNKYSSKPTV